MVRQVHLLEFLSDRFFLSAWSLSCLFFNYTIKIIYVGISK